MLDKDLAADVALEVPLLVDGVELGEAWALRVGGVTGSGFVLLFSFSSSASFLTSSSLAYTAE